MGSTFPHCFEVLKLQQHASGQTKPSEGRTIQHVVRINQHASNCCTIFPPTLPITLHPTQQWMKLPWPSLHDRRKYRQLGLKPHVRVLGYKCCNHYHSKCTRVIVTSLTNIVTRSAARAARCHTSHKHLSPAPRADQIRLLHPRVHLHHWYPNTLIVIHGQQSTSTNRRFTISIWNPPSLVSQLKRTLASSLIASW